MSADCCDERDFVALAEHKFLCEKDNQRINYQESIENKLAFEEFRTMHGLLILSQGKYSLIIIIIKSCFPKIINASITFFHD